MIEFDKFKSFYVANFGYLDGEDGWRDWVAKQDDWGRMKLVIDCLAEAPRKDRPRLGDFKREMYRALSGAVSASPVDAPVDFLCRTCGNTGKMVMLWHRRERRWLKPGVFEPALGLDVVDMACWCSYGAREAGYSKSQHSREAQESLKHYAFTPAFAVFERAGRNLPELPADDQTRLEFAMLREDGWLFWARETVAAQVAACAHKANKAMETQEAKAA